MKRPLAASDRGAGPYLRRFTPLERTLHVLVIISFFGLVITGTPLYFSHTGWAWALIHWVGGFQAAGLIHRVCAVITFGYFGFHVGHVTYRAIRSPDKGGFFWGPNSIVPQPKDVQDIARMFKWFLGKGARPRFDRFSYMDKFDYWGEFWGVAIIGSTGLMLWFPEFFARFLPGWTFNVATIVHGIEALLATGVIFTAHFFNVHLRPEKFPIDVVIFTGRATTQYMKEEHPLEYERAVREGRLEGLVASPPSRGLYLTSVIFGFASLAVGITLIALILWAVLR